MIGRKLKIAAIATLIGAAWLAAPALADQAADNRGEVEKNHDEMVGSEQGSQAPSPEDAREVELSHEDMQSTDHEGHIEAPPTGRASAE